MTIFEAEQKANETLVTALEGCGLVDGVSRSPASIASETNVIFWRIMPTIEGTKKDTYITYSFMSLDPSTTNGRADNQVAFWTVIANLDIYTTKKLTDKSIMTLLSDTTKTLENKEIIITFGQELYDSQANRYHKPLELEFEIS